METILKLFDIYLMEKYSNIVKNITIQNNCLLF